MIWREKRTLLIVLGLLLLANTIFFFTYRVQYQNRLDELDTRLEEVEGQLLNARNGRLRAERSVASYGRVEGDVKTVFEQHWSTQQERLTALIAEVKRLAQASGLVPPSYSFDRRESKSVTVNGRRLDSLGASEVGMSFAVQGTYAQVRRLINLLELSRQFVIIDRITLTAAENESLTLNLHIKTLFRDSQPAGSGRRM